MKQIFIAGFGGQGVLFTGRLLAYAGMAKGMEVTWLPSYGPETRGGTSNCSVIISDGAISSPLIAAPDILICMNLPSLDKFEKTLAKDGTLFIDSSLVTRRAAAGLNAHYIPATQLAVDNSAEGLANMILLGKVIRETGVFDRDTVAEAVKKIVSERRKDMVELNVRAIDIGVGYIGE
jgi:2-oxoglutarate ferredoxin oxidoreductase subunit gamma